MSAADMCVCVCVHIPVPALRSPISVSCRTTARESPLLYAHCLSPVYTYTRPHTSTATGRRHDHSTHAGGLWVPCIITLTCRNGLKLPSMLPALYDTEPSLLTTEARMGLPVCVDTHTHTHTT